MTVDDEDTVLKNGAISIEGNKIRAVGKNEEVVGKYSEENVIDGSGMVAMPGLVKTHTHTPMTLLRGYADDLPLMRWLKEKIWPMEAKLKPSDVYYGSLLACLELTSFGVTTFSDMYMHPDQILRAVKKSGLRAVISPAIFDVMEGNSLKDAKKFFKIGSPERVEFGLGPHSPYACSRECLEEVRDMAIEKNMMVHIHASETREEMSQMKKKYGMTSIEFLDSIGLLNEKTPLAHTVWASDEEIKIIRKRKAKVVHCPISNMKLASGVAPIDKMTGINVSLGSDGPSSNNNLDMFEEMKLASLVHKLNRLDPTLITARQSLRMGTINGARTLGLNDTGTLEVGKKADLILLDFRKPHLTPVYNPISHLVYSCNGGDVDTTICDGKVLMRNRKLNLDSREIMKKVNEIKKELLER